MGSVGSSPGDSLVPSATPMALPAVFVVCLCGVLFEGVFVIVMQEKKTGYRRAQTGMRTQAQRNTEQRCAQTRRHTETPRKPLGKRTTEQKQRENTITTKNRKNQKQRRTDRRILQISCRSPRCC